MSAEKEKIEALKKEAQDTTELEANSLDEQARRYFRRMVSNQPLLLIPS
jgi:arginyl-tRNA synthetase